MKLKIIIPIVVVLVAVLAIGFFVFWHKEAPAANQNADIILYYGNGCPHCAAVEKYISDNGILRKYLSRRKKFTEIRATGTSSSRKPRAAV